MRALALFLVVIMLLFGTYQLYLHKAPTTDQGTTHTQAVTLAGVRMDLLELAKIENSAIAETNHCASMEELASFGNLAMTRTERDGYTYEIFCKVADFEITASHPPAPEGSAIRYPTLVIDSTNKIREVSEP